MYAPACTLFSGAGNSINSSGQANPFQWPTAAFAKEAAQRAIKLRGAGAVRHWFYDARSSRAPQGHVGLVG
jgi:hypothetical protein